MVLVLTRQNLQAGLKRVRKSKGSPASTGSGPQQASPRQVQTSLSLRRIGNVASIATGVHPPMNRVAIPILF